MNDLKSFLKSIGGLHDSQLEAIIWLPSNQSLELRFDDMYWNFEGSSEYPGATPGTIILKGVQLVKFEIEMSEKTLNVSEFSVEDGNGKGAIAALSFWPGGRIIASFQDADFPENKLLKKS
jgi:hypothetical protein